MAALQAMTANDALATEITVKNAIEHGRRAFALKKFEQAVDHYATALELTTKKVGENAPETADLYLFYGKALLENAIAQNSVLGKEQRESAQDDEKPAPGNGPILSFSGDGDDHEDDGGDDSAVDLLGQAAQDSHVNASDEDEDDGEGADAEPEDDFNAAWEVLDLARAIYNKQMDDNDDDEVKLKLADTYIILGDVSLETEKFDQAILDYEAGLTLKIGMLPISSRHIAEAHYKLSMVLDLTPGRLADAIVHAEKALESVESRLADLRNGLSGQLQPVVLDLQKDLKGKGKTTGARIVREDFVQDMSKTHIEAEIKELSGLQEDLALKVEELKTLPSEALSTSAPALAAQALDKELNTGSSGATESAQVVVNDLTSIVVKKKKKPVEDTITSKRKADIDSEASSTEKKVRLDEQP